MITTIYIKKQLKKQEKSEVDKGTNFDCLRTSDYKKTIKLINILSKQHILIVKLKNQNNKKMHVTSNPILSSSSYLCFHNTDLG